MPFTVSTWNEDDENYDRRGSFDSYELALAMQLASEDLFSQIENEHKVIWDSADGLNPYVHWRH